MLFGNFKKTLALVIFFVITFTAVLANAANDLIFIQGEFIHKGAMPLKKPLRLTQAILHGQPKATAYRQGFSFERASQKSTQATYKAFLLKALKQLKKSSKDAASLYYALKKMPVTGRMRITTNFDGLFFRSHVNPLLMPSDVLYLPSLPNNISILGWAGQKKCPFDANKLLTDYLKAVTYSKAAEKNNVYVISPAGKVTKVPVAYWNRIAYHIAPGAIIYVPISNTFVKKIAPHFNLKMAQFLSTQRII